MRDRLVKHTFSFQLVNLFFEGLLHYYVVLYGRRYCAFISTLQIPEQRGPLTVNDCLRTMLYTQLAMCRAVLKLAKHTADSNPNPNPNQLSVLNLPTAELVTYIRTVWHYFHPFC